MASLFAALVLLFSGPAPSPCSTPVDAFSCATFGEPGTTHPAGVRWYRANCDKGAPILTPCEVTR